MRYCLGRGVIGPWPFVDISVDDFEQAKTAQRNLLVLLDVEEKFGMVVDNFLEYERELLDLALDYMAWHGVGWSPFRSSISLVNRKLANFLTASRLYIDHAKHDISEVYGEHAEKTARVHELFSVQYDRLLGYRVMEAIRNSLQHRSLPITSVTHRAAWEDRADEQLLHHRVIARFRIKDARDDRNFKRSVIQELEQGGEDAPDITPFVRQYVEGLSSVHHELRLITSPDIESWKGAVLGAIQLYRDVCSEDPRRVVAYQLDDEDTTIEEVQLFRDALDRLEEQRKRRVPTNVSRWYVSNKSDLAGWQRPDEGGKDSQS